MRSPDPTLPLVFRTREALAAGLSRSQIHTRIQAGAWVRLRRGAYTQRQTWTAADPRRQLWLRTRAELLVATSPVHSSHASAAATFRLPVPLDSPVWLTSEPGHGTKYRPDLRLECATLPPRDRWTVDGDPVTAPRRTVADSLRHLRPPDGLAIADAAFHRDPGLAAGCWQVLEYCADWPFANRGRRVLGLASDRRESPLESRSFWFMHQYGVPLPLCQVSLYSAAGDFLGRVDFWWDELGVAGEVDGIMKYAVPADGDITEAQKVLLREKRREDAIRRTRAGMVRWGAVDMRDARAWAAWLWDEVKGQSTGRFQGRAALEPVRRPSGPLWVAD